MLMNNSRVLFGLRRTPTSSSSLRLQCLRSLSSVPVSTVTKPEEVIAECASIRESIQALNDVSMGVVFA